MQIIKPTKLDLNPRPVIAEGQNELGRKPGDHSIDIVDIELHGLAAGKAIADLERSTTGAPREITEQRDAEFGPWRVELCRALQRECAEGLRDDAGGFGRL